MRRSVTRAYAPAVELDETGRAQIARLRDAGVLPADVDVDRAYRSYTAVVSGVISQQLSNAPDEPFETGRFTAVLPDLIDMWLAHHRTAPTARPPRGVPS